MNFCRGDDFLLIRPERVLPGIPVVTAANPPAQRLRSTFALSHNMFIHTQHSKKLAVSIGLACCLPGLAAAGEFFRTGGGTTMNEGGKQITITVSTQQDVSGQLYPTVTWRAGGVTQTHEMTSEQLKPKAWFVFVESGSRIWMFDGKRSLRVLLITESKSSNSDSAEDLKACPKEVRQALPDAIRKKYFDEKA